MLNNPRMEYTPPQGTEATARRPDPTTLPSGAGGSIMPRVVNHWAARGGWRRADT